VAGPADEADGEVAQRREGASAGADAASILGKAERLGRTPQDPRRFRLRIIGEAPCGAVRQDPSPLNCTQTAHKRPRRI